MKTIDPPNKIYAYIEKKEFGGKTFLMDFIDSNNADNFVAEYETATSKIPLDKPTMMLVDNYSGKTIREKVTYELNPRALEFLDENNQISIIDSENSYVIGFEINAENLEEELFLRSKSFNEDESFFLWPTDSKNKQLEKKKIPIGSISEIIIRNVGQGNWNEIYTSKKLQLIFDFGTHYPASKIAINNLVKSRVAKISNDQPALIISHWDVDHYHCLFGLGIKEISNFSMVIFRTKPPTLTARKAHQILALNNKNCFPINPETRAPKGYPCEQLRIEFIR